MPIQKRISQASPVYMSVTLITQVKWGKKTLGDDPQISRTQRHGPGKEWTNVCLCFCSVPVCIVCGGLTESTHVRAASTRGFISGRGALERSYADRLPPRTNRWTPMGAAMLAPVTCPGEHLVAPPTGVAALPKPTGAGAAEGSARAREADCGNPGSLVALVAPPAAPPAASTLPAREAGSGHCSCSAWRLLGWKKTDR